MTPVSRPFPLNLRNICSLPSEHWSVVGVIKLGIDFVIAIRFFFCSAEKYNPEHNWLQIFAPW